MRSCICISVFFVMMHTPAYADMIEPFDAWKTSPVQVGDKLFVYRGGGNNFNNAEVTFSLTDIAGLSVYAVDFGFANPLTNTTIDLDYSVTAVISVFEITGLRAISFSAATSANLQVTNTYFGLPDHMDPLTQLIDTNNQGASTTGHFGNTVYARIQANLAPDVSLNSLRNGYSQTPDVIPLTAVPEPSSLGLLVLGAGAVLISAYRRGVAATV